MGELTSNTLAITDVPVVPSEQDFKIYPIPAKDLIILEFNSDKTDTYNILIVDQLGKPVFQSIANFDGTNTNQLNIQDLSSGLYFVNIKNSSINITKKIVVVK